MVIGGGISGMTAARSATAAGYKVTLVEKEGRLGGWAARFRKVFPKHPPYKDLEDSGWQKLAEEVEADPDITVHKSTTVKKTSGQPGQFAVELQNGGSSTEITVGSIILASGWKPYAATTPAYPSSGRPQTGERCLGASLTTSLRAGFCAKNYYPLSFGGICGFRRRNDTTDR